MKYDDNYLFEMNCFSPSWAEDVPAQEEVKTVTEFQHKDLETLKKELSEIKEHIQDVQAREWHLTKLLNFHDMNLARE